MAEAYILINCEIGSEEDVITALKSIDGIKEVHGTFGAYDIIAEIHAETQEEFERTVSMNIRRLSRVVSTMTLNVVAHNE